MLIQPLAKKTYIKPVNKQKKLINIWQKLLGVSQIGVAHDFFQDLGGTSLLSVQLLLEIDNAFGVIKRAKKLDHFYRKIRYKISPIYC